MTGNNVLAIRVPNKQQRLWNTKVFHKKEKLIQLRASRGSTLSGSIVFSAESSQTWPVFCGD
jgi:hypothetical protein